MKQTRVAIVGCGAVTEKSHLPALAGLDGMTVTALVDTQRDRAAQLAGRYSIPACHTRLEDAFDVADALILAVPHHLHASMGKAALEAGKHVLVEKPLARDAAECDLLVRAAEAAGRVLAVGQVRRYLDAYRATRSFLKSGILGEVVSFDVEEGAVYRWPVASDFFFQRSSSGGGVLIDTGAHVLDALIWWLGDLQLTRYADDAHGGVEADCALEVSSQGGARGRVVLSRIRALRNTAIIRGQKATLEVSLLSNRATLRASGGSQTLAGEFAEGPGAVAGQSTLDLFRMQAQEWLKAIRGEAAEVTTAREARRSVALIERCYAQRVATLEPWQRTEVGR